MSEESLDLTGLVHLIWEKHGGAHGTPEEFNKILRERIPPRGDRFNHDHHDTFMYIERSKNRNVVAYTANMLDASTQAVVPSGAGCRCLVNPKDPVHAYFINIEPSYIEARRKKGVETDLSDLNYLERKLAYGCNAKRLDFADILKDTSEETAKWWDYFKPFALSYVALHKWAAVLLVLPPLDDKDDTLPVLVGSLGNTLNVVLRVYVCSKEPKHFYQLPSVEYIEIFGLSVETGEDTYVKKMSH